ncbi:hypothetical protein [Methanobacterium oryzae]|uniref:hypothetical protein n=1 Tax=Methanobacterium oryzae TaxID=69540 RepID=UPI003D1F3F83
MRGRRTEINEMGILLHVVGTHDWKIKGYEINSTFFPKKEYNNLIESLENEFGTDKKDIILSKIEEVESRYKEMRKLKRE